MDEIFERASRFDGGFAMLAEADDLVEDALSYFPLCGFGDFDDLVAA